MKNWTLLGLLCVAVPFSGCTYFGSFLICNFSGKNVTVTYRTKSPMSSMQLFSNAPSVFLASFDGDEVVLAKDTLIPYELNRSLSIVIPSGYALKTGDDVNAWMHEEESYADLEELSIVQDADTSILTGSILPSFVQELGDSYKGLVIQ